MAAGPEVFDGTVFPAGTWAQGGTDRLGTYAGGAAGAGSATLTGTLTQVGDTATAVIGGQAITLRAYSDIPGGVLFTTTDFATYYAFLSQQFQPSQSYAISYTVAGNSGLACFAAGSRIATPRGEVPVEALRVGDAVTLAGGGTAPVVWLGHRRVRPGPPAWPVRLRPGAFAPGQPARDLYLSPEHAIAVAGGVVPIRHLCNGATIAQEPVDEIDYWHVELPQHALLLAEGLPVESYLDTGNRAALGGEGAPADALRIWAERGCAKLLHDAADHAPIRRRLEGRARALGFTLTDDPGLHLLGPNGTPLATTCKGDAWQAMLPPGTAALRLLTRTAIPAEVFPLATDRRRLGLAVTRLELDGAPLPPEDPRRAEGWHAPEPGLHWTDGAALLRLVPRERPQLLRLHAALLLRYWLPPVEIAAAA